MADEPLVVLSPAELLYARLHGRMFDYLSDNLRTLDQRLTDFGILGVDDEQHPVKCDL